MDKNLIKFLSASRSHGCFSSVSALLHDTELLTAELWQSGLRQKKHGDSLDNEL